jgi:hypothetical protein
MKNLNLVLIQALIFFSASHTQENNSPTINVDPIIESMKDFVDDLNIDQLLTLLSIGKIKQLVDQPHVVHTLQTIQTLANNLFDKFYANNTAACDALFEEHLAAQYPSQKSYDVLQVIFQKSIAHLLYSIMYDKTQDWLLTDGTPENHIIFKFQLTPEDLKTYLAI